LTRITISIIIALAVYLAWLAFFHFSDLAQREDRAVNILDIVRAGGHPLDSLADRLKTYGEDGRKSVTDLYRAQIRLEGEYGWGLDEIFSEEVLLEGGGRVLLPASCLRTRARGPALWIISGIHGEEPAGPNALVENVSVLAALGEKGIPVVLMPLCNPLGYCRNWRYRDAPSYSEESPGSSVGDSDHLLPDEKGKPRRATPVSPQCDSLTGKVLALSQEYPPLLTLDFHEDDELDEGYIYSQGILGAEDPVAKQIVRIFKENRFSIRLDGQTRFGEKIRDGIIADAKDGSIDELLGSERILASGVPKKGPSARSVIVLETSSMRLPLEERKKVHAAVLRDAERLWRLAERTYLSKEADDKR
jgi:hypothetical protein